MAEIKTRILLRNDTLANWESASSVTLKKGEVGIAMLDGNLAEVRIGNDTTWANSKKLRIEATQISGLIDTINTQVNSLAYEYQIIAGTGEDANKWLLQSRHLSGGDWGNVSTIDLTQLSGFALSTDVDTLVGTVSAETLVSANAYTDNAIDALSIDNYMLTSDFSALSNEIGLSAASASNKVVTLSDIADLAGAMHFRGAVTPTEGQTDEQAISAYYEAKGMTPAAGDIVIITTNSREYVYNGSNWIELGAEDLYATKAEVGTVSANTLSAAKEYTDNEIDALSIENYALSADVDTLVGTVSAETLVSANAYTDNAIDALSIGDYIKHGEVTSDDLSGFFVFDCGTASYRDGEEDATEA